MNQSFVDYHLNNSPLDDAPTCTYLARRYTFSHFSGRSAAFSYRHFINQTISRSPGHELRFSSEDRLRVDIGDATAPVIDADNTY